MIGTQFASGVRPTPRRRTSGDTGVFVRGLMRGNEKGFEFLVDIKQRWSQNRKTKPVLIETLPRASVAPLISNGHKVSVEEYFDCAFRLGDNNTIQVAASHAAFELHDKKLLKKKK